MISKPFHLVSSRFISFHLVSSRFISMLFLLGLGIAIEGCAGDPEEVSIQQKRSSIACPGQTDKLVSNNYLGANEEWQDDGPETVLHSAAAEVLWGQPTYPSNDIFALAWVRFSDKKVYARRYNTATKDFMSPEIQMSIQTSSGWVRTLGPDEDCIVLADDTCAWFTWETEQGTIQWRAIGHNGDESSVISDTGHQPSGDTGVKFYKTWPGGGYFVRKKLLAYISPNRTQVLAKILGHNGQPIMGPIVIGCNFRRMPTITG